MSGTNFCTKVFMIFILVILAYTKEKNTVPGDTLIKDIYNTDLEMSIFHPNVTYVPY